jgi:hypothetical protein
VQKEARMRVKLRNSKKGLVKEILKIKGKFTVKKFQGKAERKTETLGCHHGALFKIHGYFGLHI